MQLGDQLRMEAKAGVALVIGFNIHGLAVARALHKSGVEVYALAQKSDLPSVRTRFANVLICEDILAGDLIKVLLEYRSRFPADRPVVLFPTNDNMVHQIAENWILLEGSYIISWAHCRDLILELPQKDCLADYCERAQILYPKSIVLNNEIDLLAFTDAAFPAIVKPVRPLSSFKAIIVENKQAVANLFKLYPKDPPFLFQQYIAGGDETLWFCTMFLSAGRELCAITGRKLRSSPKGTGMGSVVESRENSEILNLSRKFIDGLDLSGPVAMEFKRDSDGKFWFIEPNVGRTEYCVDLIVQSGTNLPLIEYQVALGLDVSLPCQSTLPSIWFDTERDPLGFWWAVYKSRSLQPYGRVPVFPYFGQGDAWPVMQSTYGFLKSLVNFAKRRCLRGFQSVIAN